MEELPEIRFVREVLTRQVTGPERSGPETRLKRHLPQLDMLGPLRTVY